MRKKKKYNEKKYITQEEIMKSNPELDLNQLNDKNKMLVSCKCGFSFICDFSDEAKCPKCGFEMFVDHEEYRIII